jgi:hypothetical protein
VSGAAVFSLTSRRLDAKIWIKEKGGGALLKKIRDPPYGKGLYFFL